MYDYDITKLISVGNFQYTAAINICQIFKHFLCVYLRKQHYLNIILCCVGRLSLLNLNFNFDFESLKSYLFNFYFFG